MRSLILIVLAALVSGCASSNWHRPGADEAQVRRDLRGCEAVAARRYNEQLPQAEQAAVTATPTEQPDDEPASYSLTLDTEALSQGLGRQSELNRLLRECMLALGYEPMADD